MNGAEDDVRMPLTAHLEELRTRLIRMLLAAALGFACCYGFAEHIVSFLLAPLTQLEATQQAQVICGVALSGMRAK